MKVRRTTEHPGINFIEFCEKYCLTLNIEISYGGTNMSSDVYDPSIVFYNVSIDNLKVKTFGLCRKFRVSATSERDAITQFVALLSNRYLFINKRNIGPQMFYITNKDIEKIIEQR